MSMKISSDQIDTKAYAGKNADGNPIVYIASKGGLHAFFCKNKDGQVESLAAAPHKAIALWMAEQKDPKIEWDSDFISKSEDKLTKSEREKFDKLRHLIFIQGTLQKNDKLPLDEYFIYDTFQKTIGHSCKADLIKSIEDGKVGQFCLVRNCGLSEPVYTIGTHPEFKDVRVK